MTNNWGNEAKKNIKILSEGESRLYSAHSPLAKIMGHLDLNYETFQPIIYRVYLIMCNKIKLLADCKMLHHKCFQRFSCSRILLIATELEAVPAASSCFWSSCPIASFSACKMNLRKVTIHSTILNERYGLLANFRVHPTYKSKFKAQKTTKETGLPRVWADSILGVIPGVQWSFSVEPLQLPQIMEERQPMHQTAQGTVTKKGHTSSHIQGLCNLGNKWGKESKNVPLAN